MPVSHHIKFLVANFAFSVFLTVGVAGFVVTFRNVFIAFAAVSLFFSFLIIFENIYFLVASNNQHAVLLLIPYLLSWILVTLACIFGRIAFLLHSGRNKT
ncbi:hypothetical protein GCK32_021969, partial [Trichostrongylus colubriformis]